MASRYIIDPDIESATSRDGAYDTLTSPRRGGVRFVDDADRAWAEAISADGRTTDQYMSVHARLLHPAASDTRQLGGRRNPAHRRFSTAVSEGPGHKNRPG